MATPFDKSKYKSGFWSLMATQFQGAFSDNLFQYFLVFLLIGMVTSQAGSGDGMSIDDISATATMLFALPFILFPGLFGALADRYSKRKVTVGVKVLEIGIMAGGALAILSTNVFFLWAVLFAMATQSALFGPAKYGILPEMLPEDRLSWGNGLLQMGTMIAVIAGVGMGGPVYEYLRDHGQLYWVSIGLVALACIGLLTARSISPVPAANPKQTIPLNPYAGLGTHFKVFWNDRLFLLVVLAYCYFWFAAALLRANLLPFGIETLALTESRMSIMLAVLSIGIGVGAVAAGYMSRGKVETGLIPLGAFGMALFSGLLAWNIFGYQGCLVLLFGLGFFGGIFDVPLIATIQQRSPDHIRGGIMATVNMLTWVGIFAAGALFWLFSRMDVGPYGVFLICAGLSLGIALYLCTLMPIFVLRLALWVLSNTLYRVRVIGRTNIPEKGGALLVANHTSFLDALIILASIDRPVRFIMYQNVYDVPWIKPLAKMMGVIPVSPSGGPREVVQSLRTATETIKRGDLVCIFGEGQITRTGHMLPVRKGFERVMRGIDAPIIPVFIDQIWGKLFTISDDGFSWKFPKKIPYTITIAYGPGMPSDSNAYELRGAIQQLGTEAVFEASKGLLMLQRAFVRTARRRPLHFAIADERSGAFNFIKTLASSIVLARKLKPILGPAEKVGLLLPQSVGGVLANVALQFMGKVPVNLNYTGSNEALDAAAGQCGMEQVITANAFLEQVPVKVPRESVFLDDILKTVTTKDRIIGLLFAVFCPVRLIEAHLGAPSGRSNQDLATIVFSSGSEGEPKGIMLSHINIMSNIVAGLQVFPHKKGDCVVGMLPFFHSFGFTATLWLVLTNGLSAVYHPNPMEVRAIGDLIEKYKGKIMFSTSTFLHGFIRRCTPKQMASLENIISGAEKLAPRVRDAFKEKFGIEPLEGYGTTECAPIVSLNVPDIRAPGFFQKGLKRGSIGLPLPGVSVRIVDTETREVLQNGEAGLLMVKGPNVMLGYLGQEEKTDAVLHEGWYETGDISTIDEDGFITITDRLARFSKIAGEMVSHTLVEEALLDILDTSELVLAIASVPDQNKGERLIVLHTLPDDDFENLMADLDKIELPNLWIPKPKAFYKIDEIPVLGTGKMDIKAVKTIAKQLDIGE